VQVRRPCSRCRIVQGRSEPVKAVCDRRATAAVELPGERTREDDLDRSCPDREVAAIGSRDASGQGSLTLMRQGWRRLKQVTIRAPRATNVGYQTINADYAVSVVLAAR
jgi:hypothetical protein